MLTMIMGVISYIMEALREVSMAQVAFIGTVILALSGFIEKIFGVKFIGRKLWSAVKRIWLWHSKLEKSNEEIQRQLTEIKKEVTYNGGGSIKDMVALVKGTCDKTSNAVRDITHWMKASDEVDVMMKFRADATGYWLWANRAFLDFFGFKESDVYGHNFESTIDKRDLQDVQVTWERAILTKSDFKCEYGIKDREGKVHQCLVRGVPYIDQDGLHGFYGTVMVKQ